MRGRYANLQMERRWHVKRPATVETAGTRALTLPFRPRARLLQLLGDELIGSSRLAVFELVKNAYDANASEVRVTLDDLDAPSASITVEDNGSGMTLDVIRDIWLVPGHDHRARQRQELQRTQSGRLPLGEKGVGRFAAHKLGDRIEVVTKATGRPECLVSVDWSALIRQRDLSDAMVEVYEREPEVFGNDRTGTRITITALREPRWTRGEVRRLQRQITSITSPFAERSDKFDTTLHVPSHTDWVIDLPDAHQLLKHAPWTFWFSFDGTEFQWKYCFTGIPGLNVDRRSLERDDQPLLVRTRFDRDELAIDQRLPSPRSVVADASEIEGIGKIEGRFYAFDRDPVLLKRIGESQLIRHYLDENGGVRIYRDGIRVYDYGERNDDWLALDLRRVNVPARSISRNIVVGAIDLSLADSWQLHEKTSREGFIENSAQRRLKRLVLGALTPLEVERAQDKDRIRRAISSGRDPETTGIKQPLRDLRAALRRHKSPEELEPLIDKVEREYNELRDRMLRAGMSGMGLTIVFHEVEQGVRALQNLVAEGADRSMIRQRVTELAGILEGFTVLLRKGTRKRNSLRDLVARVLDINSARFRKHGVRLDCPALQDDGSDKNSLFVFGLALGALNNLLDNAFYWLEVRWPKDAEHSDQRAIHISISTDLAEGPAIIVADTGTGFVDEPGTLVKPFFSRRPEGMGIGLYYADLVMQLSGGCLAFPDDAEGAGVPREFDGAAIALVFAPENSK